MTNFGKKVTIPWISSQGKLIACSLSLLYQGKGGKTHSI
jgi:hypothetical protein